MEDGVRRVPDYGLVGQAARLDVLAATRRLRAELDHREQLILAAMAADPDPYRDGTPNALGK